MQNYIKNNSKYIFCEKPPGRDVADIIRVIEVGRKHSNLKIMYGFNHRYHESIQEALRIIKSNKLGKIINLRGVYGKSKIKTFNQPDWRTKREIAGGGVLLDQGIHMVDLMRLFVGEFEEVYSCISNNHWGYDVEDNAYALMRTKSGAVGMLNSSATQWRHRFHLDINLEKGSLILSGILSGSKSYGSETLNIIERKEGDSTGAKEELMYTYINDNSWKDEIDEFADCIVNDRPVINGTSQDALKVMEMIYNIYKADSLWWKNFQNNN